MPPMLRRLLSFQLPTPDNPEPGLETDSTQPAKEDEERRHHLGHLEHIGRYSIGHLSREYESSREVRSEGRGDLRPRLPSRKSMKKA